MNALKKIKYNKIKDYFKSFGIRQKTYNLIMIGSIISNYIIVYGDNITKVIDLYNFMHDELRHDVMCTLIDLNLRLGVSNLWVLLLNLDHPLLNFMLSIILFLPCSHNLKFRPPFDTRKLHLSPSFALFCFMIIKK